MRKLSILPFLLMPGLSFAGGPKCAVSLPHPFTAGSDPTSVVNVPSPVLPAANTPAASPSGHTLPVIEPAPASTPGQPEEMAAAPGAPPAALSSTQIQAVPALARIASAGAQIYDLGESHGLHAVFARSGLHFQVFYLTPDGQAEIGGIMWDATGKDLTLGAVRDIPGVVPTVTIGNTGGQPVTNHVTYQPGGPAQSTQANEPTSAPLVSPAAVMEALNGSTSGSVGPVGAPHLYMLIDPMCGFSVRAMQALVPYVNTGKIHLTVIPLSVLDYEDQGVSTAKAEIMLSQQPAEMVADWIQGLPEEAGQGAAARLSANMALAATLGLKGTPTFVWQGRDGSLSRMDGMPPDIGAMIASIGPVS